MSIPDLLFLDRVSVAFDCVDELCDYNLHCQNGYKQDLHGCMLCECNSDDHVTTELYTTPVIIHTSTSMPSKKK